MEKPTITHEEFVSAAKIVENYKKQLNSYIEDILLTHSTKVVDIDEMPFRIKDLLLRGSYEFVPFELDSYTGSNLTIGVISHSGRRKVSKVRGIGGRHLTYIADLCDRAGCPLKR